MQKEIKLGPLQQKWVESLRKFPERQMPAQLGKVIDNNGKKEIKLCCLGQALIEVRISEGEEFKDIIAKEQDCIIDYDDKRESIATFLSFKKMGLITNSGGIFRAGKMVASLEEMNDAGKPWSKIADFIENNPELIFNKSI